MIRINLLTEKRAKRIPIGNIIPWCLVVIVGIGMFFAWTAGEEWARTANDDIKQEVSDLESENKRQSTKVTERDNLKKTLYRVKNDIQRLQRLSGANLVQWSQTLDTLTARVPQKTVWITNLRIDSDRRVQITAYSCNEKDNKSKSPNASEEKLTKGMQEVMGVLLKHEYFSDVFLTGATKNTYEKKPVWRFEINCRLAREATAKSSED